MEDNAEEQRRRRILLILQLVRFAVALVLIGLSIYFEDVLLGALAIGFLVLGTATTWLRLRKSEPSE